MESNLYNHVQIGMEITRVITDPSLYRESDDKQLIDVNGCFIDDLLWTKIN